MLISVGTYSLLPDNNYPLNRLKFWNRMQPTTESVIRNKIAAPCKIVNTKTQAKSIRNKQPSIQVFNIAEN